MRMLLPLLALLAGCQSAPPDSRCYSCEGMMRAGQQLQQQPRYAERTINCQSYRYGTQHVNTICN